MEPYTNGHIYWVSSRWSWPQNWMLVSGKSMPRWGVPRWKQGAWKSIIPGPSDEYMNSAMGTSVGVLLHTAIINNIPLTHWHHRTLSCFLHLSVDWCLGETRSTKTLISDKSTTDPSSVMSTLLGFVWPPHTPHSLFWENASAVLVKAQFHLFSCIIF